MMFRTAILAGLVLAALSFSAIGQKKDDEDPKKDKDKAQKDKDKDNKKDKDSKKDKDKPKKGKVYETPEACFKAARDAFDKGDYKTFVRCIAPQSQTELSGEFGLEFIAARAQIS